MIVKFTFDDYKEKYDKKILDYLFKFHPLTDHIKIFSLIHENSSNEYKSTEIIRNYYKELKKRIDPIYFNKIAYSQNRSLLLSKMILPGYCLFFPDLILNDWLSIISWKKFSRDHLVHQPLTAYIAYKLLNKTNFISRKINEIIDNIVHADNTFYLKGYLLSLGINDTHVLFEQNNLSRQLWKSIFFRSLLVSSMFHDLGYPWQFTRSLIVPLNHFEFVPQIANCGNNLFEELKEKLVLYPFNWYTYVDNRAVSVKNTIVQLIDSQLINTHGFCGSIGFMYLHDALRSNVRNSIEILNQFTMDWAALAIMMHDLKNVYWNGKNIPSNPSLRLNAIKDPLSTMLTLCDILQEFERPYANFKLIDETINVEYTNNLNCCSSIINYDSYNKQLDICYEYKNQESLLKKSVYINRDEHEFFNSVNGFIDISSLGLNKVTLSAKLVH